MSKSYRVGIVGEANYQRAIAGLREGEVVLLRPEPDNPHDPRAVAVTDGDGATIGYLPREHWLKAALLDEGKAVQATVAALNPDGEGRIATGVVIEVVLGAAAGGMPMTSAATASETPEQRRSRENRTLGIGCLVVIGLIALVSTCSGSSDGDMEIVETADPAAIVAWHSAIVAAGAPCDGATAALSERIAAAGDGEATAAETYRAATTAKEACMASRDALAKVVMPAWTEDSAPKAEEATETCRNAFAARVLMADRAAEIIDGDTSPSKMADFTDLASASQAGVMLCAAQIANAALAAGVAADQIGASATGSAEE